MEKFERPKGLILPEKEPGSFAETIDFLKERMKRIRYNQLNFLSPKGEITYNSIDGSYLLTNFYRNPSYLNAGSCLELSNALFKEINKNRHTTYKHIKILLRCVGWDGGRNGVNGYFANEGSAHNFLLVSEKSNVNIDGSLEISAGQYDSSFLDEFIVVDPSFGLVKDYESSGYTVHKIHGENVQISVSKSVILQKYQDVPLCYSSNGDLWSIFNSGGEYGLTLITSANETQCYSIIEPSPELIKYCKNDPILSHAIKKLQNKIKTQKVRDKPFEIEYSL
jgi:hypothetical protein